MRFIGRVGWLGMGGIGLPDSLGGFPLMLSTELLTIVLGPFEEALLCAFVFN